MATESDSTRATATETPELSPLRARLHQIIFGVDTPAGRGFDLGLIVMILASVVCVMLDSMADFHARHGATLHILEWLFTGLFTLEYGLRIYASPKPRAYVFSFFGMIDLLSILPTYIAFLYPQSVYLIVVRILRVLRIFRVLKLIRYLGEATTLYAALLQARRKILVFMFSVSMLIVVFGSLMFVIEGPQHGFTSIPRSIYWAIVTVTTVGYGDIAPQTGLGQAIASLAMICGYAIIAVPTGIVSAELVSEYQRQSSRLRPLHRCPACDSVDHDADARYCKRCGNILPG